MRFSKFFPRKKISKTAKKGTMTNKEAIDRWAKYNIPAVFKAETQLQREKPDWKKVLANIPADKGGEIAEQYCREIATIIVTQGSDYEPDGSI